MVHLLLVDDDADFLQIMSRALQRRGLDVCTASSVSEAEVLVPQHTFDYASIDLKMPGPSGLKLIRGLKQAFPDIKILILTGYASISTAVEAIKLGACHYLAKPVNADDLLQALMEPPEANENIQLPTQPVNLDMLEWESIHQVLSETDFNISEAAKKLGMHRRTLQRKLQKRQYQV